MLAVGAIPRIIGPWWALVALEMACELEDLVRTHDRVSEQHLTINRWRDAKH